MTSVAIQYLTREHALLNDMTAARQSARAKAAAMSSQQVRAELAQWRTEAEHMVRGQKPEKPLSEKPQHVVVSVKEKANGTFE